MFIGSISKNLVYPDAALKSRVKLVHSTSTRRTMTTTHLLYDDWLLVEQDKTPAPTPPPTPPHPPPPPPTPLFKLSDDGVFVIKYQDKTNLIQEWYSPSAKTTREVMMAELAGSNC